MHTVSHVAPDGFEAPLVQAWARLDEGPEVFCLLFCTADEAARLSAGQGWSSRSSSMGRRRRGGGTDPPVRGELDGSMRGRRVGFHPFGKFLDKSLKDLGAVAVLGRCVTRA
ncbi:hypothetical protein GBA65_02090 [Rubrobacter marinus]|uniref:Uncharacterized protein n=1 Tax=Rubrobacter marinus TaxID=2653852 RepID=A0A6G8PSL3_9ACTN|nr:hypothetical protein [Rubrobacter marinus]QIN77488.1 hypothetical protein GBA65_02090 [Rubrobacter marinus]